jgi:hypothetical protein
MPSFRLGESTWAWFDLLFGNRSLETASGSLGLGKGSRAMTVTVDNTARQ